MADLKIDKKKERDLQAALIPAVFHGYSEVVQGAGEALNKYFQKYESPKAKKSRRSAASEERRLKTTGPQMLDFLVECCYDSKTKIWRREIPAKCRSEYRRRSLLMIALQEDKTDIARQLINLGASVAFKNKNGMTALHIACSKGQTEIVELILETAKQQKRFCYKKGDKKSLNSDYEVILNARGPKGWTALMFAVHHGRLNTVRKLIECDILDYAKKNRKQQTVFQVAAKAGTLECLKEVATKSTPELMLATDKKGWNVFHQACSNDNLEMLQWLLQWLQANVPEEQQAQHLNQKSQHPNKELPTGYTPLLVACLYRKLKLVKCLTDEKLVKLVKSLTDESPVKRGLVVEIAARCHEDAKGRGSNGLHLAAETYAAEVAEVLIKAGCPLEQQDREGNTVLHVANRRGSYSVAAVITQECSKRKIDLTTCKNDAHKFPSEMLEEIIIPLEIKKRGPEAIEIYMKALNEGKTKIPRCSLLILGKEQVGKTSLYRQLVGKEFKEDLDSTRGIDNNTVDTVDRRNIDTNNEAWLEEKDPDTGQQFGDTLGAKVASELPTKAEEAREERVIRSEELMSFIQRTIQDIKDEVERSSRPVVVNIPKPRTYYEPPPQPSWQSFGHATSADYNPLLKKPMQVPESHPQPPPPTAPTTHSRPPPEREEPPKRVTQPTKPKSPSVLPRARRDPTPPPEEPEDSATPIIPEESTEEEASEPPLPQGVLTRRQSALLDEVLRGRRQAEELSLILNSFDFAGQAHYRPMHHCYIIRRALYLVVFNIEDMLKHISERPCKPVEDLRYWVQSINAHIYPPEPSEKEGDKKINRVFLVGTHRGNRTEEELKKIDVLIKSQLIRCPESKCVNHIYPVSGNGLAYFVPVENSIDCTTGDAYLKMSGTRLLQEKLKDVSGKVEFTKEEHPIKWLKFEERLEHCRKQRKVMSVKDVKQLAVSSRITDEEEQELALRFFHDTGKIIYLKYLPRLFLNAEEREQLHNMIVLTPDWLINVMKAIMELNTTHVLDGVKAEDILQLEEYGKANLELLNVCWKGFASMSADSSSGFTITIHHLCLILQAYCLIYPVPSVSNDTSSDSSDSDSAQSSNYIIPCMLPGVLRDEFQLPKSSTFVFDFKGFLLAEIYHRLICLASREAKPPHGYQNLFSSRKCIFRYLFGTHWIMEFDDEKHKLYFRVIARKPQKERHVYIKHIHKYLCDICKDSRLEGLVYYGGVECTECKDEVLHYVTYDNGKHSINTEAECPKCFKVCYEPDLLATVDHSIANTRQSTSSQSLSQASLDIKSKKDALRAIKPAAAVWEDIGLALDLTQDTLDQIKIDNPDVASRLSAVVSEWLRGSGGERSWDFLCAALRDPLVERSDLADKIGK